MLLSSRVLNGPVNDVAWMQGMHADPVILERIERRVQQSPSAPVRAAAAFVLWFAPRGGSRQRLGVSAALHFLEWHAQAFAAAMLGDESDIRADTLWLTATTSFERACEMARIGNQRTLPLVEAAANFFATALAGDRGRWSLEIAEALIEHSTNWFGGMSEPITRISDGLRAESVRHGREGNFGLQRRCLECDLRLRRSASLPQREGAGSREVAQSHEAEAAIWVGNAAVRAVHLRHALDVYRLIPGSEPDQRRLEAEIEEANLNSVEQLSEYVVELPPCEGPEWESFIRPFRELPLVEAVSQVGGQHNFVVSHSFCRESLLRRESEAPLLSMIPREVLRPSATTHRAGTTEEEQREDKIVGLAAELIAGLTPYVAGVFNELRGRGLSLAELLGVLFARGSPLEESERAILRSGLDAWLRRDFVAAISVLVPRLERLLRRLATLSGISTLTVRDGGEQRIMLTRTLEHLESLPLPPQAAEVLFSMRVFLDERGGMALRHELAHGLLEEQQLGEETANYVIVLLIHAAQFRVRSTPAPSESQATP